LALSLERLVAAATGTLLLEKLPFCVRPETAPDASLQPLSSASLWFSVVPLGVQQLALFDRRHDVKFFVLITSECVQSNFSDFGFVRLACLFLTFFFYVNITLTVVGSRAANVILKSRTVPKS